MIAQEQFLRDLESMLERDPDTLKGDESLDEIAWDSMTVVMFIAMADQKYSITVAPSKLANAKKVSDLLGIVTSAS
jgi:acyl carrier protein